MGGLMSGPKTLWSQEELNEIERVRVMYEKMLDWVQKEMYNGIPFRSGKKSEDPTSSMWVEPITIFDKRGGEEDETSRLTQEVLQTAPSGIMVDRKGKVQILFSLVGLSYSLEVTDILKYLDDIKTLEGLPTPQAPALVEATKTSLELQWLSRLPYPPGIVQSVEVQYAVISGLTTTEAPAAAAPEESKDSASKKSDPNTSFASYRWFSLATRSYNQSQIGTYTWTNISPGSNFVLRLRYRTSGTNWSGYSQPSAIFSTLADIPRPPPPPTCLPVTSFAIQIIWGLTAATITGTTGDAPGQRSVGDNGSPITAHVLMGKSVGDEFVELYRGPNKSYLLLGLYPEFAYCFQLAAVNAVGVSAFSAVVTVQTPARPTRISSMTRSLAVASAAGVNIEQLYAVDFSKALFATAAEADREVAAVSGFTAAQIAVARQCRDAWREYWDGTTEQMFYFNSILSIRQLEVPAVLQGGNPAAINNSHSGGSSSRRNTSSMSRSSSTEATTGTSERPGTQGASRRRSNPTQSPVSETPTRPPVGMINSVLNPNAPEMQFRKKRFRLLLALRRQKQNFATSKDVIHLELHRGRMLSDCYTRFHELSAQDFRRRLRVSFVGERGMDCGGLSKEAYLLLSKQAAYYGGPKYHKWLRSVTSSVLVPYTARETDRERPPPTAAKVEDRDGRPPALIAPAPEPTPASTQSEVKYVEEQVEGYFLTAVNEQAVAPIAPSSSSTGSHSATTVATTTTTAGVREEKADHQAEECYDSIIELDTQLHITSADYFRFLGRLLGKALFDRQLVDFPLSPLLLRHLLGEFRESTTRVRTHADAFNEAVAIAESAKCDGTEGGGGASTATAGPSQSSASTHHHAQTLAQLEELKFLDQETYKSLKWMSENCITDVIYETFSVTDGKKDFPLCADGEKMNVTEANKLDYIKLMIQWRISFSVLHNLVPFVTAFHEVVPLDLLLKAELTPMELNAMLNGKSEVNVEELRAFCVYQSEDGCFNDTNDTVIWFWQAMRAFNQTERRNLLLFFTGSARVPLDGYDPPLNITQGDRDMALNSLPRAHTCFNQLVLPRYSKFEVCVKQLKFAMENTVGFELT